MKGLIHWVDTYKGEHQHTWQGHDIEQLREYYNIIRSIGPEPSLTVIYEPQFETDAETIQGIHTALHEGATILYNRLHDHIKQEEAVVPQEWLNDLVAYVKELKELKEVGEAK